MKDFSLHVTMYILMLEWT